jgi:hypothetical protein
MKTEEELLKIISDNRFFLPADSNARIVFFDKEGDEIIVEVNVMLGSPMVGREGEILEEHYQSLRYALRLKLKFSDFFMMSTEGQPVLRDIAYSMQKLDEALKKIAEYENKYVKQLFDRVSMSCENLPLLGSSVVGQCAHATGKHDEECDLVAGLSAELKDMEQRRDAAQRRGDHLEDKSLAIGVSAQSRVTELEKQLQDAREEVFDLYHQACLVHPNSSDDPIREFRYDNMCMSTYESVEDKLIEWGLLKPEQCLRRKK